MAKKYLLYIHDERFRGETEKSKLVNDLLEKHYNSAVVYTSVKSVYTKPTAEQKSYDLCKHGAVKGFCKKGCK